jgi:hypothetical protein
MSNIFRQWSKLLAENGTIHDDGCAARESLCEWDYDNQERLSLYFPKNFRREKTSKSYVYLSNTGHTALVLALIAATRIYI